MEKKLLDLSYRVNILNNPSSVNLIKFSHLYFFTIKFIFQSVTAAIGFAYGTVLVLKYQLLILVSLTNTFLF